MKKLLIISAVALLALSCKKSKSGCEKNMASIAGTYKYTAYTYKATPSTPEEDFLDDIFTEPCERDNTLTLNSNGTWKTNDVGAQCTPVINDSGSWSVTGSDINVSGDVATIESYDCKTLVLLNTDIMMAGDKLRIILTRQ